MSSLARAGLLVKQASAGVARLAAVRAASAVSTPSPLVSTVARGLATPAAFTEVYEMIKKEEVFNENLVYNEVEWFYSLGLQKYYFERFSSKEIANHIHAFIAAKKVAATTGRPEEIMLNIESTTRDGGQSFLYMCPIDHARMVDVEKRVQTQILKLAPTKAYTLEFFMSEKTIVPKGKKQMGLYVLETSEFANPAALGKPSESHIKDVASVTFLRTKTDPIKERYQALLSASVAKISPLAQVYPTYRDGTTPVMFAFYQSTGTTTSYILQLTELLKGAGLVANRKFIETFANGVIVFSLYIQPSADHLQRIETLLKQFSMLHLVPESTLTSRFLNGDYTAEQYTYFSTVSRFVYYFLNKRSEEFDVLSKSLKHDQMNLGRLRLLQTRLKREAVSQERILSCIQNHSAVVIDLFKDFDTQLGSGAVKQVGEFVPTMRKDLLARIKNEATTLLDQQILTALASFNAHLLKTNFYTKSKAALSFRLDPRFLMDSDWPQVPFGVFFVMGSDFQGFHIRFQDIARGGIRIIRSGDRQAYNSNLETLFAENYGLAYTQNKKNKDIPEFGSKGTILLNLTSQTSQFRAFQKYTSGLLDLIIPTTANKEEKLVDKYGKEEILFLGPDEGTADFMESVASTCADMHVEHVTLLLTCW
jgi:glutamate dehydrogenase